MHSIISLGLLAGAALAAPAPQLIDLAAMDAAPNPVLVAAPVDVVKNIPAPAPTEALTPITTPGTKRDVSNLAARDACSPQPTGSGPTPSPDTDTAFTSDSDFAASANGAPTPDGYTSVFTNLGGSLSAPNYMGLYTFTSYDTLSCASQCDQASGCMAFNVYIERDPSEDPADACPNPPSTTNYKCTLWGVPVTSDEATNNGQWRNQFHVVIAGSNGYNKVAPPAPITGYTGPTELGGAINAPLDSQGHDTYMGYKFFPFSQSQGYTPQTCADACTLQTTYNSQHPNADGTFQTCEFFDAYVLSQNAIPQGLYCSLYNETWTRDYATNYGQTRGSDRYTVSESYSYSLSS